MSYLIPLIIGGFLALLGALGLQRKQHNKAMIEFDAKYQTARDTLMRAQADRQARVLHSRQQIREILNASNKQNRKQATNSDLTSTINSLIANGGTRKRD